MLRFLFSLALLGLLPVGGHAQTYFSSRYTNPMPGAQTAFTTIAVRDSGYLTIGIAYDYPSVGSGSLVLQFVGSDGQTQRTRYYHPPAIPGGANSLHRLPDGGFVLTSQAISATFPLIRSTKLWRFNALGDTLWTRQWTRQRGETPESMCVLPDGGFAIISGLSVGLPADANVDFEVTRTDALGRIRWWQTYNNLRQDYGYTIAACPDGGLLLGGYSYDLQQSDSFVVKTDSLGQEQWRRTFGSPIHDELFAAVTALRNGSYFVATTVGISGLHGDPHATFRPRFYYLDANGQTRWQQTYGPEREVTEFYTAHELPDGRLVAAGQQGDATPAQMPEAVVLQLCPDGDTLWYRTHKLVTGPDSHNYLRDLRPTPDGGFVAAGFLFARAPDVAGNDGWVFRLDSAGYRQAGGAPVTRRCRPVGLPETGPAEEALEFWPNPATTTVTVRLPANTVASTVTLYDPIGRACRRLVLPADTRTTTLPLAGLAPGVYRYYLQAGARGYQGALLVQP